MPTQPRISAPIGRVDIRGPEARKRKTSGSGRWRSAEPPMDAEVTESDEGSDGKARPRFYPFPLRAADETDD